MSGIFTPVNQVRLTNVSVVRLKRDGKRFELACYKNKVLEWRKGVEKDIDNVLQTHTIFAHVNKGQAANKDDLDKAFAGADQDKIIQEILKKGELQVSEKERQSHLQNMWKDIANTVASKCVNPATNRPYTVTLIEKAMTDAHYSIHPSRNTKQQALDVIKLLKSQADFPIQRAQMRVKLTLQAKEGKNVLQKIKANGWMTETDEIDYSGSSFDVTSLIDPGVFRLMTELVQTETKGRGSVEVLSLSQIEESEATM